MGFGCSSAVRVCVGALLAGIPESHKRDTSSYSGTLKLFAPSLAAVCGVSPLIHAGRAFEGLPLGDQGGFGRSFGTGV